VDLDLTRLSERCEVSPRIVAYCVEAASVMLDKFHKPPPPPTNATVVRNAEELHARMISWQGQGMSDRRRIPPRLH
jgi:hypothetical protein